jgi:hypothetical protein
MNKWNTMFWASTNPHKCMETSLHPAKCSMWCAINEKGLTGLIFVEGYLTNCILATSEFILNSVTIVVSKIVSGHVISFRQAICPHTNRRNGSDYVLMINKHKNYIMNRKKCESTWYIHT